MDKKRICFNARFQMYVAWTVSIKVYPQCNRKLTEWPSHWHWTAVGPPVHRHLSTLPAAHPQALRHYIPLPSLCKTHLLNKPFSLPRHDCYFTKDFIHSHIIYNILKIFSHISKFIRNTEFRKCFSSSKKQRQPLKYWSKGYYIFSLHSITFSRTYGPNQQIQNDCMTKK